MISILIPASWESNKLVIEVWVPNVCIHSCARTVSRIFQLEIANTSSNTLTSTKMAISITQSSCKWCFLATTCISGQMPHKENQEDWIMRADLVHSWKDYSQSSLKRRSSYTSGSKTWKVNFNLVLTGTHLKCLIPWILRKMDSWVIGTFSFSSKARVSMLVTRRSLQWSADSMLTLTNG